MATPEIPNTEQRGSPIPITGTNGAPTDINVAPSGDAATSANGFMQRGTLLDKLVLLLRSIVWIFAFISLIIMASNKHGDGKNFDQYEEYKYCLAVSIIALLYGTGQIAAKIYDSHKNGCFLHRKTESILDFAGDQVVAYLLISGMSAATPLTDYMRGGSVNLFTDSAAASISMTFFAFVAMAFSALISGYKLSNEIMV